MARRTKAAPLEVKGLKALEAYAARIGAEQLNYKRWMVKERVGVYYIERALITINTEDRKVYYPKDAKYAPTEVEIAQIAEEIKDVKFPDSIPFKNKELILREAGKGNDVTFFISRKTGQYIMAQERVPTPDGKKYFRPWTVWEDGKVRAMEPTGKLPLWKPDKPRNLTQIMVHEGGKAARYVDWLVNDESREAKKARDAHPWIEYLSQFEHWGMIGGALSPHRTDYSELWEINAPMVVYVCDNDSAGRQAMKDISRNYGRTMQFMRFSNSFPEAFDLADPFPEHFWSESGHYNGPIPEQFLRAGTWATDVIPNPSGKGAPIKVLKRLFKDEWFTSVEPEMFINKYFPDERWDRKGFNSWAGCFSDSDDLAKLMLNDPSNKLSKLIYDPGKPSGLSEKNSHESKLTMNTHVPSFLTPQEGDPAPFLDYLNHLIVDDQDRENMKRFIATLIARPDIKMGFGVLMVSQVQGVGKSTLGEAILQEILGSNNVSFPGQSDLVDQPFNHWLAHKRLIFVHEIYAGASSKAYNKLKSVITDVTTSINMKFIQPYTIDNWAHVIACSNSMRALKLPDEDRRWFVPEITEHKKPHTYWSSFNNWLKNEHGKQIIMHWAHEYLKEHAPFKPGEIAPPSGAKQRMIEEAYSPGQNLVAQTLENIQEILKSQSKQAMTIKAKWQANNMLIEGHVFITDMQLVNLIKEKVYDGRVSDRLEKPLTIRKLAKARGWHLGEIKAVLRDWPEITRHGRLISTNAKLAATPPSSLCNADMEKEARKFPLDLSLIEGM